MRRTRIGSLITAGVLSAILVPATALGIMGVQTDPTTNGAAPVAPAAPAAWTEPAGWSGSGLAAAKRATVSARLRHNVGPGGTAPVSQEPASGTPTDGAASPSAVDPIVRPVLKIRLGCELAGPAVAASSDPLASLAVRAPAVACRWSAVNASRVRAYQLWRAVDVAGGGPRQLIATIPAGQPLRHIDLGVSRRHVYTYAVVAVGKDGSKLAVSEPAAVRIPPAPDGLRMACALASVGDHHGVACKWSESRDPGAAGYVLWRSVDGGPREAIYKTGPDGRLAFLDANVKPGQTIRYAVIVLDKSGARLGMGGPVAVRIPVRQP